MRILFTSQRYGENIVGGSEFATRQFAERLSARGHDVTVVTSCATSYTDWDNVHESGESDINGVVVVRLPVRAARDQRVFGGLHKRVLRRDPMFHFEQQLWAEKIGPELAGFADWLDTHIDNFDVAVFKSYLYFPTTQGLPLVSGRLPTVFHAEAHPEEMLDLPLYDGLFRLADAFQFGAAEERELIAQRFGFDPVGGVVGVGVDPPRDSGHSPLTSRLSEIIATPYVVVLGRFGGGKGSETVLANFAEFRRRTSIDLRLVFAGEEPVGVETSSDIVFAGFLDEQEKEILLSNAVCLIQPSLLESFSIVLVEAWNVGTPVLADGHCAVVAGQVGRSGGGLLYANVDEFVAGLSRLMNGEERSSLGTNGRAYVDAHYRWDVVLDRFLEVTTLATSAFRDRTN